MEKQIKMKPLKSVLSVLLSVLIVFSGLASTTALAAEESNVLQNVNIQIVPEGTYKFTPSDTGWYLFESVVTNTTTDDTYINIITDEYEYSDDDSSVGLHFKQSVYLYAGKTVEVMLADFVSAKSDIELGITYWAEEFPRYNDPEGGNGYDDDDNGPQKFTENGIEFVVDSSTSCRVRNVSQSAVVDGILTIPATVNGYKVYEISMDYECDSITLTTLNIPATVTGFYDLPYEWEGLKTINVDANNPVYKSINGVVYSADLTEIEIIPSCFDGEFVITKELSQELSYYDLWNLNTVPESYKIEEGNTKYKVKDGILVNAKTGALIRGSAQTPSTFTLQKDMSIERNCFEGTKIDTLKIAPDVTELTYAAFLGCTNLKTVDIPGTVKTIGPSVFAGCKNLTTVTIGEGTNEIVSTAFNGCSSLTSIKLPDSITEIGAHVFDGCSSLETIVLPKNITYLGSGVFYNCTSLKNVTIPDGVTEILWSAFGNCKSLTSIIIPDGVTEISWSAFENCKSLTSITIPNKVKRIEQGAFSGCESLSAINVSDKNEYFVSVDGVLFNKDKTEIIKLPEGKNLTSYTIPDSVISIGSYAFEDCTSLTNITIPNSVKSIGYGAFKGCESLANITLPVNITSIDDDAFLDTAYYNNSSNWDNGVLYLGYHMIDIKKENVKGELVIKDGVKSIQDYAFYDCDSLTSVTIPDSVTSIGEGAFYYCKNLATITIPDSVKFIGSSAFGDTAYYNNEDNWDIYDEDNYSYAIYIGNHLIKAGGIFGEFAVKEGTKCIAADVFNYSDITSVTIPDSVTSICGNIFWNIEQLVAINVSSGNKYYTSESGVLFNKDKTVLIKYPACKTQLAYEIPSSVTSMEGSAFQSCDYLTKITIPNTISSIGQNVFAYCSALTDITIPNSVKDIGFEAFRGCESLKNIVIPDSVTRITENAFMDCKSLTSVTIPNGVTSIEDDVFRDCTSLTSVIIPDSVTSINFMAFLNCSSLKEIKIPDGVEYIGSSAFSGCTSLTSVVIPNSVTCIEYTAFEDCTSLKSVTIPASVSNIGDYAFGYTFDEDTYEYTIVPGFTIYGTKGTAAEVYANENNIKFVNIHTHSYEEKVTTAPTCEGKGVKTFTCGCGDSYTEEIPATGHSEKVLPAVGATCTATGLTEGKQCTVCGTVTVAQQTVDKKAHTEKVLPAVGATCTATGLTEGKQCTVCGTVTVAQQTIPATGHKEEVLVAVAPTCEGTGLTEGKKCTVCGVVTVAQTEVAALGHTESDWIVDKAASFSEEGSHHKECTVCKKVLATETLPMQALEVPVVKIANATNGIKVSWSMDADATGYTVYRSEYNAKTKTWSKWSNRGTAKADKSSWVDTKVNHGTYYKYTVRSVNGKNMSEFKATGSLMFITTPAVKIANNAAGMKVAWSKVAGATGYTVYRSEFQNGAWTNWKTMGTAKADKSSWVDKNVVSGVEYKYTVRAVVNKAASAYVDSNVAMYLAQPTVKAVNAANGVSVSWNAVNGAQNYKVYRSVYNAKTKKWSGWSELGTVAETSCVDSAVANNTHYKYTVRAVNGANISTYVASKNVLFVTAPTVKIANNAAGMKVAWSKVAGATGYTVYRSELQNGAWTKWKTMGTAKADKSSWIDKSAVSGVEYKYTVRALNNKVASAFVDSNSVIFLAQPTVKIAGCATGIKVTWNGINGAQSYNVYRAVYNATTKKWSGWSVIATATETNYVDATAVSGTYYKYTVRAVNGKNMSTYKATGALYYLAEPVTTLTVVENGINVAWTQSAGATGYTVYRSQYDPATNTWSKWSNRGTAKANKNNWTDKKTTQGVTYKYAVRAVNGKLKSTYTETAGVTR